MNDEHVIPRSLGGFRSTIIRSNKKLNSDIGSKIDAKISNDFIFLCARRDANAKGASKKPPTPIVREAAAWQRGQSFEDLDRRYNLEIPSRGQPIKIYDRKTGHFVGFDLSEFGFVSEFRINSHDRARFVAKTFLGMGWRIFGNNFLSIKSLPSVRDLMGIKINSEITKIYYFDQFLINTDESDSHPYIKIQHFIESSKCTRILLRRSDFYIEWTVCCLGKTVGTILVPDAERHLPLPMESGEGILIEPTSHEIKFYAADAF